MSDIFELTERPDTALLFRRDEQGDPRLGEVVFTDPHDIQQADVVLVGCPQHEGVRRNGGRTGAADAPDAIRRCLYKLVAPPHIRLFDIGSTRIFGTLEETHAAHQHVVAHLLRSGAHVISLGGGNDIAYPDCAALASVAPPVMAINIDTHLDVRESPIRHSGTPYRQLLEEGRVAPENFYETCYQPFAVARQHLDYLADKGVRSADLSRVLTEGVESFYRQLLNASAAESIFWGVDMDAVRASDAPGVSAPSPTGLSGDDLLIIARIAAQEPRTRVFEISEVNPAFDIDQRTSRLAAIAIWTFLDTFYDS